MSKKGLGAGLLVMFICCLPVFAATKNVMIFYDQSKEYKEPVPPEAHCIANLLGHFDARIEFCPAAAYRNGTMDAYDVIFYVTYDPDTRLPAGFKSDILKTGKTVCWMNLQLDKLDQRTLKEKCGFHFSKYIRDSGFKNVLYHGTLFPRGDTGIVVTAVDNAAKAKVAAYASDEKGGKVPYAIRSGNFWYFADSPFAYYSENDRYLVFTDLLHDIMRERHKRSHIALVRLEDVNPTSDPKALLQIAEYLHSRKIPFSIALFPVYVNPAKGEEVHLADRPQLLSVLKMIPRMGGTFVLHGYTHQYKGMSADDYEFWDEANDKPIEGDSVENSSERIEKALRECFSNGIYPFAWETPHYLGSENTYRAVSKYFSVSYGRRNIMDYLDTDQFFPYPVTDRYGERLIPENLGYVHEEDPELTSILSAAKLNLAVRDGYASFFIHLFVGPDRLNVIVKGLKTMGYRFGDIRDFSPEVQVNDEFVLAPGTHRIKLNSSDKYVSIENMDFEGKVQHTTILPNTAAEKNIKCPKSAYCTLVSCRESDDPGRSCQAK